MVVDNSLSESDEVYSYGKEVELAYTQYQYDKVLGFGSSYDESLAKKITIDVDGETVDIPIIYDGDVVCAGKNSITVGKLELHNCKVGNGTILYSYSSGKVVSE